MFTDERWQARTRVGLAFVVVLALALRGYHYLSNPPVWHDEAALITNVLDKSYGELLGPLYYSEAGPPLFLWAEKAVAEQLGDSTYTLRLLPMLATMLAFLAVLAVARRVLPAEALLALAVLFGCSDRLLWHGSEAKPYAVDVLVAVALLATFVYGRDDSTTALTRRLLFYSALSPFLIFLSFPSCFLLGGAALALLPAVLHDRRFGVWSAYALFGVLLCGSFLLLYVGPVTAQKNERMFRCWADNFPDWNRPWSVLPLGLQRLTEMFRYASEPIGNVLFVFAPFGAAALWRAGRRRLLAFITLPAALAGAAWLVRQYPFGAARVTAFLAPGALLLVAAGLPPVFAWARQRARWAIPALAALLLVPIGQAAYRVAVPWARLDSATPAAFVLSRRLPSEPVAGTLWEHLYYFRRLGPLYRPLASQPTEPVGLPADSAVGVGEDNRSDELVKRLWLVCIEDNNNDFNTIISLASAGEWRVVARYGFRDMTALYLERRATAGSPDPAGN